MSDFRNSPPPHIALFDDAPELHALDGPILTGEQREAIRQGERIAALERQVKDLQAQLADLSELRELNAQLNAVRSEPPIDLRAFAYRVADIIRQRKTDADSRE